MFSLLGLKVAGSFSTEALLLGCLSGFLLACTNAISNITNQVHDRDIDLQTLHKKNRPIPSGEVSVDEALSIVVVLTIIVLGLAWYFFPHFYGILLSIILMFSWMYNSPPLRLKARFFWSNLSIAAPRGGLGIVAAFSAFASPFDSRVLIPALAFGIYVFGVNTLKDYEDYEADRKMGVRNFCTVLGKEKASALIVPFLGLPYVVFAFGLYPFIFLTVPIGAVMVYILCRYPRLEGRGLWMWRLFYLHFALMMVTYVLPFLLA